MLVAPHWELPLTYQTPGVYVQELPSLPPAIAQVETAIPAFVGYTQKARAANNASLRLKPTRIASYADYQRHFGSPPELRATIGLFADGSVAQLSAKPPAQLLAHALRLYFGNGGGPCWVVSVGSHGEKLTLGDASTPGLLSGLSALASVDEPTLLCIPDAARLPSDGLAFGTLVQAMLTQCGERKDRFAILDVQAGDVALDAEGLQTQRNLFGSQHLSYGAAYYPFLDTTLSPYVGTGAQVSVGLKGETGKRLSKFEKDDPVAITARGAIAGLRLQLPPSAAVAGVYAMTDRSRGVWKAPANVALANVLEPVVPLSDAGQVAFNIDAVGGKSICVIRRFPAKGTLIWGARTLAGNDNEWRYVSVRRTLLMIEQSLLRGTRWAVFEPNDARTWVRLRAACENFLNGLWRDGALVGSKPEQAYYVRCGLGQTMTAQDVAEGRLLVTIGVTALRPAEFIVTTLLIQQAL